jgi:thioredoxin-like negative regulator of GroEL
MAKTMEKVDAHYNGKIKFVKMDIDKNPFVRDSVTSIPTLLLVKNGQGLGALIGAQEDPKVVIDSLDAAFSKK